MSSDIISVIIPTHNRVEKLVNAIRNVNKQKLVNVEIIIVDDASKDKTKEVVSKIKLKQSNIKYFKNKSKKGAAFSRNLGVKKAKGKYIAFLDDDDFWFKNKLFEQLKIMKLDQKISAISCNFFVKNLRSSIKSKICESNNKQDLLKSSIFGGASVIFVTKENFTKINGFDISLPSGQDWDLWIRLNKIGKIKVIKKPLVVYDNYSINRISNNTLSNYTGRKKLFFKYFIEMSENTRKYLLLELIFLRKVIFQTNLFKMINGLLFIIVKSNFKDKFRFIWRFIKTILNEFIRKKI